MAVCAVLVPCVLLGVILSDAMQRLQERSFVALLTPHKLLCLPTLPLLFPIVII
jgi:hypothetical protein